jgi:putative hemolysin
MILNADTFALAMFGICLCLSFLFSGMEAGVFALNRLRIRQLMRSGNTSARLLYSYLENPENFLWTILVGNTLVNFFILGFIVASLHAALSGHRVWFTVVFLAIVFLFYALFDLLPKMLFRTYPNRLSTALAPPFRLAHLGLHPLVALVEWCSRLLLRWTGGKEFTGELFGNREELRLVMQESSQALTSEERAMINRVLDLQTSTLAQITTPLAQTVTVTSEMSAETAIELCREHQLTRLPVWGSRDNQRRIVGVINVETLLFEDEAARHMRVEDHLEPAVYLGERMRLEEALRRLQKSGQHLAVVLGRNGREMGIVSLQDILKRVFGQVSL